MTPLVIIDTWWPLLAYPPGLIGIGLMYWGVVKDRRRHE